MLDRTDAVNLASDLGITEDAQYFEYTKVANPIGAKLISKVPFKTFAASLYADGPTRVVPLDLSAELGCPAPATGPSLIANFVRIVASERVHLNPLATSQVFYVIRGSGSAVQGEHKVPFVKGAFFTLPGGIASIITADEDVAMYYVSDAPLLTYLGVTSVSPRFSPTLYPAARAEEALQQIAQDPNAANRSRISVLLSNANFPQTATVTHVLWAMYGLLPGNSMQKPHRHQSIALDFIVDCPKGCYTLVGTELDEHGNIADATRVDWTAGLAFVTPPGYWHAHFNESDEDARLIPVQDAGLQTYLRALDIRFAK